jgi:hypothetical protein
LTLQNLQARVQVSPKIMNVAVPADQHSAVLGHAASVQTVWSFCLAMSARRCANFSLVGGRMRGLTFEVGVTSKVGRRKRWNMAKALVRLLSPFLRDYCGYIPLRA